MSKKKDLGTPNAGGRYQIHEGKRITQADYRKLLREKKASTQSKK